MAEWVAGGAPKVILDPGLGTGLLLREAMARAPGAALIGYEIDSGCLARAAPLLPVGARLIEADFLTAPLPFYDGLIANPPYLRRRDLPYEQDIHARIGAEVGERVARLANASLLFALRALHGLAPGGRGALLLPAEWANANFGLSLKRFLAREQMLAGLVYFSHEARVFEDNLSTGLLLLIEKGRAGDPVPCHYLEAGQLPADLAGLGAASLRRSEVSQSELAQARQWDALLARGRPEPRAGLVPLGAMAGSRRGLATGANGFFHLARREAGAICPSHLRPVIGKARQVRGYSFTGADFAALEAAGEPCLLVDLAEPLAASEAEYVAQGEAEGLHQRHLSRHRRPWFRMEPARPAPLWAATFGRAEMRFIVNQAGIGTLTAFHGIYPLDTREVFVKALAACLNAASVQQGARGRGRVYAGGLVKFEPKDLLEIALPDLRQVSGAGLAALAECFDQAEARARRGGRGFEAPGLEAAVEAARREASAKAGEAES